MTNRWSHADSREYQTQDAKQHVGLKNQGATCYMNSLLQQLFHIPEFRHSLLSLELEGDGAESPAAAAAAATAEDKGKDKAVLFELQSLFALLQTSEKKAADTLPFCRSLTDYTGEPLLLHEQKDVDEFATLLFDKLESLDPRMDGLLKGLFGGTLVNQVISHECPHRSEREEPFPMLKVDVKNKSSLEDSLELYVAGELLAGDNKYACRCVLLCPSSSCFFVLVSRQPMCASTKLARMYVINTIHTRPKKTNSECGTKVEALRRTALRKLPPVLIIHLKRFEFDLERMTKFKVPTKRRGAASSCSRVCVSPVWKSWMDPPDNRTRPRPALHHHAAARR